jgi:hypothetical protein
VGEQLAFLVEQPGVRPDLVAGGGQHGAGGRVDGAVAPLPGRRARPASSSIASDSVVSASCTLPRAASTAVFAAAFAGWAPAGWG